MGMFSKDPNPAIDRLVETVEKQAGTIATLRQEVSEMRGELSISREALDLAEEVVDLKRQVTNLEIEKSKKTEEFEREKRETLHFVGLEKKRQTFEIDQAKRETSVSVREENLSAEQKRFTEQMEFHKDQIAGEVKRFEGILENLFARLPEIKFSGTTPAAVSTED